MHFLVALFEKKMNEEQSNIFINNTVFINNVNIGCNYFSFEEEPPFSFQDFNFSEENIPPSNIFETSVKPSLKKSKEYQKDKDWKNDWPKWKDIDDPILRKRVRNNLAASRSRKKKLEYVDEIEKQLEEALKKIAQLEEENAKLKQYL